MPGATINPQELTSLQDSIDNGESPEEALAVLSGAEYDAYREDADVDAVMIPLRKRIFQNIPLPEDFEDRTNRFTEMSLRKGLIENSNKIAVLCRCLQQVEETKQWILRTLAQHLETSEDVIKPQLRFTPNRVWFDGPVAVAIVEDTRNIADQLKLGKM